MYKDKFAKTAGQVPNEDHYAIITSDAERGIDDGYGGSYTTEYVKYQHFTIEEKPKWLSAINELEITNKSYSAHFVKVAKVTKTVNVNVE